MTDQPTLRDRIEAVLDECRTLIPSAQADAVMGAVYGQAPTGDVATWTAIRAIQLMNDAGRQLADHRLALSQALGLGTGAPWDAIQERASELAVLPAPADRGGPGKYYCDNCDHAFVAPTDTESCICSCGNRAWQEKAADRAAVLAEVEHLVRKEIRDCGYAQDDGCDFCNGVSTVLEKIRRMADEAQQPEEAGR
jgi:hypothetical protein